MARLKNQIAVLLDSGTCGVAPSTVVDLTEGDVEIVRQGVGELV